MSLTTEIEKTKRGPVTNHLPSARDDPAPPVWWPAPDTTPKSIKCHYIISPSIFFLRAEMQST